MIAETDPQTPLVSILIVSFNTREMTLECLRTVIAETRISYELIVIDNASSDGSAAAIRAEFPDLHLIEETDNHGFAKANNIAARHATGEYVLLLNPDTLVLDRAIDTLMAFAAARPEAKIWGGMTLNADHSLNPASCWRRMSLWTVFCRTTGLSWAFPKSQIFNAEAFGGWDRGTERQVDIVTGCFFLLKRSLWDALGGFNLTYVMYGEEADLCHRAMRDHGAAPRVTPDARIVHYGGASEKARTDKTIRLLNAKLTLIRHHFKGLSRPLGMAIFRAEPGLRALAAKAASLVIKSDRVREAAATYGAIWARRGEWWNGYPDL